MNAASPSPPAAAEGQNLPSEHGESARVGTFRFKAISFEALGWYLLILLLVVVFGGPARSFVAGSGAVAESWGTYDGAVPQEITWYLLAELDLVDGSVTPGLAAVDGQVVALPGYLVPLDDDLEKASEFLLVPYFGACVHLPPPPENQIVHVRMRGNRKIEVMGYGWDPTWIVGRLRVGATDSPFGAAAFQLEGFDSRAYVPDKENPSG